MQTRTVALASWALLGVPLAFGLVSYLSALLQDRTPQLTGPLAFVWVTVLVVCAWSGAKALLRLLTAPPLIRIGAVVAYVLGMYFVLLGIGFISLCAYGCG